MKFLNFSLLLFCTICTSDLVNAREDVFNKMKSLAGMYTRLSAPELGTIEYRVIANESALMEIWNKPDGRTELTVFHMNNGQFQATHYCTAGMQPTLVLSDFNSDINKATFTIKSVSNLDAPDQPHAAGFSYTFLEDGSVHRTETWAYGSERKQSEQTLVPSN
jgi:hypothetical protein